VRRQLLVESSFLAFLGGLSGFALAMLGSRGLLMLLKLNYPAIYLDIRLDSHVIGFIALTTLGAGVIFGVAPAFFISRIELGQNLRAHAITLKGTETRIGRVLVSAEVALCFVLLAGAGLVGRSLRNLLTIAPGFNPDGVTMIDLDATRTGYKGPALAELHAGLLQNLASLPGVKAASLSTVPPLTGGGGVVYEANTVSIDGGPIQKELQGHLFENSVSTGFFNTLEIPLIAGRDFDSRDHETGSSVVIVSEQFAHTFFGHGDCLGHRISIGSALTGEIIGIAKDSRYENLREQPALVIYRAYRQDIDSLGHVYFEVRGQSTPAELSAAMRRELGPLAGSVSISPIPLVAWLNLFLVPERILSILLSSFALIALILASTGLYAIISHFVTRRRGEIAVRIMLGARRGAVLWLVVRNVLLVFCWGLVSGGLAALLGRGLLSSLLYGLAQADSFTFVAVPLLLLGIGMLAAYLPMRRAVRTDPNVALRCE
jgi:predicted permease